MTQANYRDCQACYAPLGVQTDGDVTMCTSCGQWHHYTDAGGLQLITGGEAARLAETPMDPYDLLDIMDAVSFPEY